MTLLIDPASLVTATADIETVSREHLAPPGLGGHVGPVGEGGRPAAEPRLRIAW
jgi:hypothetical protein